MHENLDNVHILNILINCDTQISGGWSNKKRKKEYESVY